jgi:transposase-like protein
MSNSILSQPYFHNEEAAYAFVEKRVWPHGPVCPKCGVIGRAGKLQGTSTRIGVYKCYDCRKPFTVKVGTIFESSHIPLRLWLQAIFLIASSKKGISSNQLHRTLGVTLKSAWFMSHRIREAMRSGDLTPFGGDGGEVEVDETFIGRDPNRVQVGRGGDHKMKVLALVDRTSGQARSMVIDEVDAATVAPIVRANIAREARLLTDESRIYKKVGKKFSEHRSVNHSAGEYVQFIDPTVHINTVEGLFSVFKRGMKGVYQHCGEQHLHRYLAEFEFRYNNREALGCNDGDRSLAALKGIVGKRLTYAAPDKIF